jgi:hypothetical protein
MKNVLKILGVIALVAVIGFGFVSCGGDDDKGGNTGGQTGGGNKDFAGTVSISPTTASVGTKLTATYSGSESITLTFQWKKDGSNVGTNSNEFTPTAAGSYTVTISAEGYNPKTSAVVTITAVVVPTNANVSVYGEANYWGTGANTEHLVNITLSLPSGAKWTLPYEEEYEGYRDITDAQALAAVKSWVTIGSSTTPAITGWDFYAFYDDDSTDDSKIVLSYYRKGTVSRDNSLTATIVTTKLSEMKSYTNVTGTLTATTPGTGTITWHNVN